jgi:AcrR family transcriptional regulator
MLGMAGKGRGTTKERILSAALELFAREGYEAVGVARIAQAVGIKAPSLYKHFASKRAVFEAILRRMEELDAEAAAACSLPLAPPGADPAAYARAAVPDLVAFAKRQFRFWTRDPFASAFRRMVTVEQHRSEEMAALYQGCFGTGPLDYTAAILGSREEAVAFYGPMFLLYAVHDANPASPVAAKLLAKHLSRWLPPPRRAIARRRGKK